VRKNTRNVLRKKKDLQPHLLPRRRKRSPSLNLATPAQNVAILAPVAHRARANAAAVTQRAHPLKTSAAKYRTTLDGQTTTAARNAWLKLKEQAGNTILKKIIISALSPLLAGTLMKTPKNTINLTKLTTKEKPQREKTLETEFQFRRLNRVMMKVTTLTET